MAAREVPVSAYWAKGGVVMPAKQWSTGLVHAGVWTVGGYEPLCGIRSGYLDPTPHRQMRCRRCITKLMGVR